jgi:hypothetical protein
MNRYATLLIATLAVLGLADSAKAGWGSLSYGGYQPWWNILGIGKRHGQSPEERRLQRFWHDYYDAQRRYYKSLEHLDWVAYYKNHGQMLNGYAGCGYGYGSGQNGCQQAQMPIQFAPVTVSPAMAWAVPGACGPTSCGPQGMAAGYGYAPSQAQGYPPNYAPNFAPNFAPNIAPAGYYYPPMGGMFPGYGPPPSPPALPTSLPPLPLPPLPPSASILPPPSGPVSPVGFTFGE